MAASQDRQAQGLPAFRAAVHLNTVTVAAIGVDGLPVVDLTADDFELWLDGEPQEVAFVLAPSTAPLELGVLIDSSGSIGRNAPDMKPALQEFLGELGADDCVLVMPFADSVGPGYWNVDVPAFVDSLQFDGDTRLHDAILSVLNMMSPHTGDDGPEALLDARHCGDPPGRSVQRRQAAVLITDGHDQGSLAMEGEVLLRSWSAGVPVVVLGIGDAALPTHPRATGYVALLDAIVMAAGGRFIQAGAEVSEERVFDEALRTLRSTYVLASELADPPTNTVPMWHTVEVRVRREGVVLAAPEGIYLSAVRRAEAGELAIGARDTLREGQTAAALERIDRAIAADPEFWVPHFVRAVAAIADEDAEETLASARRVVYLSPLRSESHTLLAQALLQAGRPEEAAKSIVAAAYLGAQVGAAVSLLEAEHGVVLDAAVLAEAPRVWIAADDHLDLPLQEQATRIARLLMTWVAENPSVGLVARSEPHGTTSGMFVEVTRADPDGGLEGVLKLGGFAAEPRVRQGFDLREVRFRLSPEQAASLIGFDAPKTPASLADAFAELLARSH